MRTTRPKAAPVGVIGKVLRVLELLDRSPSGLQLRDIAEQTKINKSTAHRFLTHLESEAYLFRDATGAYMLGPKLIRMGSGNSLQATLRTMCRPILERLWKITGETVNLSVLDGSDVLYLDVLESLHTFRLVSQPGMRRPVYCTSMGKAMLAWSPRTEMVDEILAAVPSEPLGSQKLKSVQRLRKELGWIRERGYALDDEEAVMGARCLGAPILNSDGEAVAAISISGPTVRITKEKLPAFTAAILGGALEVSKRLGYRPPVEVEIPPAALVRPVPAAARLRARTL